MGDHGEGLGAPALCWEEKKLWGNSRGSQLMRKMRA
jgi:hypothetical protein